MNVDSEQPMMHTAQSTPSAEFIHAISEFFDTDPSDLLVELGYYKRTESDTAVSAGATE